MTTVDCYKDQETAEETVQTDEKPVYCEKV